MDYLADNILIEQNEEMTEVYSPEGDGEIIFFQLTEKGFDVAHERELAKRRDKTNTALVAFTFVLVLVGVVGNFPNPNLRIVADFLLLGGLIAIVWWTDVLDLPLR